jgi:hypothetical protein
MGSPDRISKNFPRNPNTKEELLVRIPDFLAFLFFHSPTLANRVGTGQSVILTGFLQRAVRSGHPSSAWRIDELAAKVRKSSGFLAKSALSVLPEGVKRPKESPLLAILGRKRSATLCLS